MRNLKIALTIGLMLATSLNPLKSCTVFFANDGIRVLAATNKDWNNLNTRIRVMPSTETKYGIIYLGYNIPEGFQNAGGINEFGLWYDGASLPFRSDIHNYYNKPERGGELCERALEECKTVEEVIALYSEYYSPHWQGHSMWGDQYGNSVIVEFGEKDVVFIERKGKFQLMTNFYLQDTVNARWHNCPRYNAALNLLESKTEISENHFTDILNASHQEGILNPTLYSNIYDLANGIIHIYNFHNYKEVVRIEIARLLEMGDQNISIPDLFHKIEALGPKNDKKVSFDQVSLSWLGKSATYSVMYSTDSDFSNYTIQYESDGSKKKSSAIFLLLTAPLFIIARRKKIKENIHLGSMIIILFVVLTSACSKFIINPYPESELKHKMNLSDLQPETKYYWKIIGANENGIDSESRVQNFVTSE